MAKRLSASAASVALIALGGSVALTRSAAAQDPAQTALPPARLVADINPNGSSAPQPLARVGRILFFMASDGVNGTELWRTDGSEAGTFLVKDIRAGALGQSAVQGVALDGRLLFSADDGTGTTGKELWVSDGSEGGTTLLKDINPGSAPSSPTGFVVSGGKVFFQATTAGEGAELWATDGTSEGTTLVKDLQPGGTGSTPAGLRDINGRLYFVAGASAFSDREPWTSDGTAGGTSRLRDIASGTASSNPGEFTFFKGRVYFAANAGTTQGTELWRTDGTEGGTELVKDIAAGGISSSPATLTAFGDQLLFVAVQSAAEGRELWASDGTDAGTAQFTHLPGSGVPATPIAVVGASALFFAQETTLGSELWRTDGTPAGTMLLKDINPGKGSSALGGSVTFTTAGLRVFFAANDGTTGSELWATDGTEEGTFRVSDIPGPGVSASGMMVAAGTLYFSADDGTYGKELWAVDYDLNPPSVTVTHTVDGRNGWNVTPATVQIHAFDLESPLAGAPVCTDNGVALPVSGEAPDYAAGVSGDGVHLVSCTATDTAGNEATAVDTVKIDTTAPVIVFTGNQTSYAVDEIVTIACTATDAVSQVASTSCADVTGPAYEFPLGENTIVATATDFAGNTTQAQVTFTVTVDFRNLAALVTRFTAGSNKGTSLNAKLAAAAAADDRGNARAKTGVLGAFVNEVAAQTGKRLTAEQAAILVRLVGAL